MIPFSLIHCQPTYMCQRQEPVPSLSLSYGYIWDSHSTLHRFPSML